MRALMANASLSLRIVALYRRPCEPRSVCSRWRRLRPTQLHVSPSSFPRRACL